MERFPALRLMLRYGRLWSLVVAVAAAAAIAWLLAPLGPVGFISIPITLPFFYFLAKSYVELIQIVVEMVN